MSVHCAAVLLAPGFEEIEAVTVIDVLRRAGIEVTVAGLEGAGPVPGAHEIRVAADRALSAVAADDFDLVVVPGGLGSMRALSASAAALEFLRRAAAAGRWVGAICAGPLVLAAAGLCAGRRLTLYPGLESKLAGARCTGAAVECDGRLITGRGPGTALEFALELVAALCGRAQAAEVAGAMLAPFTNNG